MTISLPNPNVRLIGALLALVIVLAVAVVPAEAQRTQTSTSKDPAADKAAEMYRQRAAAEDVIAEVKRTYRVDDARAVALLVQVGYGSDQVASAAGRSLRADGKTVAEWMSKAGVGATDIASGLSRGLRLTATTALAAMDGAGVRGAGTTDVFRTLGASADDIAAYMHGKGEAAASTAAVLAEVHQMRSDAVASSLLKRYAARDVARLMKDDLSLDRSVIERALADSGLPTIDINDVLEELGFGPEPPVVTRWYIRDYALGSGPADIIENAQIVNRNAVLQGASQIDGVVWIQGNNLDHPDVEVWAGTTGGSPVKGEIRSVDETGFVQTLEVFFPSMPDAGFRVSTPGGDFEVGDEAWPAGYAAIERDLFETALEGLEISMDHANGVEILFGTATITGPLDEERENGVETRVTDVNSDGFELSTESEPNGAALVLTISFEESGREFEGSFFGYIPCWKCSSYEVPQSECSSLSINCLMDFLGANMASLATCANPANWEEDEILDTQGVDFDGDLANTTLAVRMAMHVDGSGLGSSGTTYDFDTDVSINSATGDVEHDVIDDYVRGRVNSRLTASMAEIDLAQYLVNALNQYASLMGWDRYLSMAPMPNGRLFVSFAG